MTGRENLELDEGLLQLGRPGFRVAVIRDRALSLGVAQADDSWSATRARAAGIPVLRRRSGGSGVLHLPGDLVWSLVLPRDDPRVGRDYVGAYARLGSGIVRFLNGLGVRSDWVPAFGLSREFCLFGSRGRVLAVDGRAVGGAAQHLTARALLHHGIVLQEVDRRLTSRLFGIGAPELEARLVGISDLGVRRPSSELAELLRTALQTETGIPPAGPRAPGSGRRP